MIKISSKWPQFADDTFKYILLSENHIIFIRISLKFVPFGLINDNPAFVHKKVWRQTDDNLLFKPMLA